MAKNRQKTLDLPKLEPTPNIEPIALDLVEFYISRAEIFYAEGSVEQSIENARLALALCKQETHVEKSTAIRIFIAKALARLGRIDASNREYRALIDEGIYLPPIILGLLHNNLNSDSTESHEKAQRNMELVKLFLR